MGFQKWAKKASCGFKQFDLIFLTSAAHFDVLTSKAKKSHFGGIADKTQFVDYGSG